MGWDSFRVCMIVSGSSYSVYAVPSEFLFRPSTWFTAHSFFVAGPVLYCTVLSENPNHLILSDSLSSESILFYIVLFHTISPIAATSHDNYNTRTRTISQRNAPSIFMVFPLTREGPLTTTDFCPRLRREPRLG